jgi:hypothetical protein
MMAGLCNSYQFMAKPILTRSQKPFRAKLDPVVRDLSVSGLGEILPLGHGKDPGHQISASADPIPGTREAKAEN